MQASPPNQGMGISTLKAGPGTGSPLWGRGLALPRGRGLIRAPPAPPEAKGETATPRCAAAPRRGREKVSRVSVRTCGLRRARALGGT